MIIRGCCCFCFALLVSACFHFILRSIKFIKRMKHRRITWKMEWIERAMLSFHYVSSSCSSVCLLTLLTILPTYLSAHCRYSALSLLWIELSSISFDVSFWTATEDSGSKRRLMINEDTSCEIVCVSKKRKKKFSMIPLNAVFIEKSLEPWYCVMTAHTNNFDGRLMIKKPILLTLILQHLHTVFTFAEQIVNACVHIFAGFLRCWKKVLLHYHFRPTLRLQK